MLDPALLSRQLDLATARALGGESFEVSDANPDAPLATLTVEGLREGPASPAMVQFALSFRGPPEPFLPQATYRFRNARLGDYAIFITALGRTAQGYEYEACFSYAP